MAHPLGLARGRGAGRRRRGWLPWIWFYFHDGRTEFYYYAVVFDPFLVIAITLCLGLIIGSATATPARRAVGAVIVGAYLLAVLGDFAYIYPVLAAKVLPYPPGTPECGSAAGSEQVLRRPRRAARALSR